MCVCLDPNGKRGDEMAEEKTASEAWNVLGFGITLAHVHGKTQRGTSSARQMRPWKSAWPWLLFYINLTFFSVLKKC